MEVFLVRGWEPVLPGVRWFLCTFPNQSAIGQWGWGFHTVRGGFDPGDHRFRPQVVGGVDVWRALRPGGGTLSSPGCAGYILEPQPISDRPAGLGFQHRAGRFRPGASPLLSPGCRSCRCMEDFLNRGSGTILPGCGEIVGFPRGATRAARAFPPLLAKGRAGGGASDNGIGARKTLG